MYAAGAAHPYKDPCVRILAQVEVGTLEAAVNIEVLQELLYRYSHIKLADKGIQLCRAILRYPLIVLPVTQSDIQLAVDLFEAHHGAGLNPRDAVHAATMLNNGMRQLISTDKDFDRLGDVTRIDPLVFSPSR